jgi:hypothetical protein
MRVTSFVVEWGGRTCKEARRQRCEGSSWCIDREKGSPSEGERENKRKKKQYFSKIDQLITPLQTKSIDCAPY